MKSLNMDILENAEDNVLEELVPFSAEEEKTMKRVFAMSEKKYNALIRAEEKAENKDDNGGITMKAADETVVQGVEVYRRPVWYKPLCAAAAVVIMAGSFGTLALFGRHRVGRQQTDPTEPTESTMETETTESMDILPSEEEMESLFDQYLPYYLEVESFNCSDRIDPEWEQITFAVGNGMDDNYYDETYYMVEDGRFVNYDELVAYYKQYLLNPEILFNTAGDVSDKNEGDVIEFGNVLEYKGRLYAERNLKTAIVYDESLGALGKRAYNVTADSFSYEKVVRYQDEFGDMARHFNLDFVKDAEGQWKIDTGIVSDTEYDPIINYSAETEVVSVDVIDAALAYMNENYPDKIIDEYFYDPVDKLPESYYHVTDDYIDNNNWHRFSFYDSEDDAILGRIVLYVDDNGTVFGTDYRD
ncbi:hypothetical protein [uncultured Ruminococcus sp.]|uniref:hypothetical protein n=1 Tax=uncultured Ruminococcus sp. TaxID=165186 RepID=UPI002604919C|nr:hypothetical protein [uncultured Ruminococcus sp.]